MEKLEKYIKTRIEQLKEDKEKAADKYDKMWYTRCIQELNWALQMKGNPTHNCYMGKDHMGKDLTKEFGMTIKQLDNALW